MATSDVWAEKIDTRYNVVTDDAICLGKIEFKDFPEAFIKALRLYNKNANRHIIPPQFMFKGYVYRCAYYGIEGTYYMTVGRTNAKKMPNTEARITHGYLLSIPKSKISDPKWRSYLD